MVRKLCVYAIAASTALYALPSYGQEGNVAFQSAEGLYRQCASYRAFVTAPTAPLAGSQTTDAFTCLGSILAMNTMLNDLSRAGEMKNKICSTDVSVLQAVSIFMNWAEDNPQQLRTFSSDGFRAAMIEHYSCDRHPWE